MCLQRCQIRACHISTVITMPSPLCDLPSCLGSLFNRRTKNDVSVPHIWGFHTIKASTFLCRSTSVFGNAVLAQAFLQAMCPWQIVIQRNQHNSDQRILLPSVHQRILSNSCSTLTLENSVDGVFYQNCWKILMANKTRRIFVSFIVNRFKNFSTKKEGFFEYG